MPGEHLFFPPFSGVAVERQVLLCSEQDRVSGGTTRKGASLSSKSVGKLLKTWRNTRLRSPPFAASDVERLCILRALQSEGAWLLLSKVMISVARRTTLSELKHRVKAAHLELFSVSA